MFTSRLVTEMKQARARNVVLVMPKKMKTEVTIKGRPYFVKFVQSK